MQKLTRPAGILSSVLVFLLLAVVSVNNGFYVINDSLNDWFAKHAPKRPAPNHVITIKVPASATQNNTEWWQTLLAQIQQGNPKLTAFNFIPKKAYPDIKSKYPNVVLSNRVNNHYFENEKRFLAYKMSPQKTILLNTPTSRDNRIYRKPVSTILFNGQTYRSLTSTISLRLTGKNLDESNYINFSDTYNNSTPKIRAERVYNGDLNPQLFKNKVILLTLGYTEPEAKTRTPIADNLSLAEFQAAVINTTLNHSWSRTTNTITALFLVFSIIVVSFIIFQQLSSINCVSITVLVIALYLTIAWSSLHYFFLRLPIAEMIFAQCITLVIVLIYRHINVTQSLDRLTHESSEQRIDSPFQSTGKTSNAEVWNDVVKLTQSLLPIHQSVFLQRIADDHRLDVVQCLECTRNDIIEKRRDYHRPPYSNAFNVGKSVKLSRAFIHLQKEEQQQYIVSLVFAHQVLGFWVYSLQHSDTHNPAEQIELIDTTANKIAENLYHKHYKHKQTMMETTGFLKNYFSFKKQTHTKSVLQGSVQSSKTRVEMTLKMLNNSTASLIVYNITGELIQANETATSLFEKTDIKIYDTNIINFISHLTGLHQRECKHYFQYTTLKHQPVSIPIINPSQLSDYSLSLKPLIASAHQKEDCLFGLQGILVEIINLKKVNDVYRLRDNVVNQFLFQLRTQLGTMTIAACEMETADDLQSLQTTLLPIIQRQLYKSFNAATQIHLTLQKADINLDINIYPVDTLTLVNQCISDITPRLLSRDIAIITQFPAKATLAIVDYRRFGQIIHDLLNVLMQDAAEHTAITINMREYNNNERLIEYHFATEGFGLANGQLQAFIDNKNSALSVKLKKIKIASQEITAWGGVLTLNSEFGEGISATLTLKGYSAHENIIT